MSSTQQVLAAGPRVSVKGPRRPPGYRHLHGSDFKWAIAFIVPYAAIFFALVVYPIACALLMASKPSLYADLIAGTLYMPTVVNTLLLVGVGVNVKMFLPCCCPASSCAPAGGLEPCWPSIFYLRRWRRHRPASRSTGC